jgi:hypothetical protein
MNFIVSSFLVSRRPVGTAYPEVEAAVAFSTFARGNARDGRDQPS